MSILAAIDFSELTAPVCELAVEFARCRDAEILLVHVAAPEPDFVGFDVGPKTVRHERAHELREEHRELAELAARLSERGVRAEARLISGATADTLLEFAGRVGVDLIVMGSHGHGALASAVLGSVSASVLRQAKCPVVVVPRSSLDTA